MRDDAIGKFNAVIRNQIQCHLPIDLIRHGWPRCHLGRVIA